MREEFKIIKNNIETELENIVKNSNVIVLHDIDYDGDDADYVQANFLASMHSEFLRKKQQRVHELNVAMSKFASGTFGVCEECCNDISIKRLLFNPCFRLCISCAEQAELVKS